MGHVLHSHRIFALLLCLRMFTSAMGYQLYKDPTLPVEERVKDLLKRMTLAEKIGQMTQIERKVANDFHVHDFVIGSVLTGGDSLPTPNTIDAWQEMIDDFQYQALSTRLGIPMLYGVDAVHGHNNVVGATIFPHNVGLGSARDRDLVKRIGAATALEVRATGIPYTFAPCVATCRDPRWGRCYESYSEDTQIVREMTDIILGLQGEPDNLTMGLPFVKDQSKVAACAKHYVGDGGTVDGINENNTVISYKGLVEIHMAPYFDAIAKGVSTIMASYTSWNGVKMHGNKFLLTKVLKKQLKFEGFIISDWLALERMTSPSGANYTYSVVTSINAGIDMVMVPFDFESFINNLTTLVETGYVKHSRIDDAVSRILRLKFRMGLFENPYVDRSFSKYLGAPEHRKLAREAVRKTLVLLKNGKNPMEPVLPLSKFATQILVVGTHAHNIGLQCGGWTITWQGSGGHTTEGTTILEGIEEAVGNTKIIYKQTPTQKFVERYNSAEYAVVVVGEVPYAETAGDSLTLTMPGDSIAAIENVCPVMKCVVVLVTGRPVVIEPYLHLIDALVAAWLPGSEADGIADVLFGDYDFVGKTSRTWFRSVDQLPMNVGDEHYDPLFPFGFGLDYGAARTQ